MIRNGLQIDACASAGAGVAEGVVGEEDEGGELVGGEDGGEEGAAEGLEVGERGHGGVYARLYFVLLRSASRRRERGTISVCKSHCKEIACNLRPLASCISL